MRFCSSCGHELGVGRFCTNCGQPVDRTVPRASPPLAQTPPAAPPAGPPAGPPAAPPAAPPTIPPAAPPAIPASAFARPATGETTAPPAPPEQPAPPVPDSTEERRAARLDAALTPGPPRTPPSPDELPAPPRFPLYADEVPAARHVPTSTAGDTDPGTRSDLPALPAHGARNGAATDEGAEHEPDLLERLGAAPTAAVAPPSERTADDALAALRAAAEQHWDERGVDADSWREHADEDRGPRGRWLIVLTAVVALALVAGALIWVLTRDGADAGASADDPTGSTSAGPADLDGEAKAKAPGNTPASQELGGDRTTYVAANMLDGDPDTAWRISGDAQGKQLLFTFDEPVTITEVGLVNGYAKTAKDDQGRRVDWYHGHRTITKVTWVFDDGTSVDQDLERNRALQTTAIDDVTTRTITLRIVTVSKPGTGRASRDATAISDVSLMGIPAG